MQLSLSQTPKSISSAGYLLRQYGGAAAAYSLQRLDTSTTNVVRARRSTDDAESNFTAEEVSGGSLREFALQNDADIIRFANQATAADKRMYFDGVDDYVEVSGMGITNDYFGACTIQATVVVVDSTANQVVWTLGLTAYRLQIFSGNWYLNGGLVLAISNINEPQTVAVDYNSSGAATELRINGVTAWTGTAGGGVNGNTWFRIGGTTTLPFKGLIYDFSLSGSAVKNFAFTGYGNTNGDWEDQVGSNDGTVSGSPALFSGQGFNAYVTTLYDQSGNGRNATQATAASQPQIVADGVVVTDTTGVPALDFDGTDDTYTLPDQGSLTAFSILAVASYAGADGAAKGIFSPSTGAGSCVMLSRLSSSGAKWGTAGTTANSDFSTISLLGMLSSDGDSGTFYKDGSADGTFASTIGQTPHIGGKSGQEMQGKISEIIYYDTDQSANRAAIEANIASRYGITLA